MDRDEIFTRYVWEETHSDENKLQQNVQENEKRNTILKNHHEIKLI